jgi:hypothetical protein
VKKFFFFALFLALLLSRIASFGRLRVMAQSKLISPQEQGEIRECLRNYRQDDANRSSCILLPAIRNKNAAYCDLAEASNFSRDYCLSEMARELTDENLCLKIRRPDIKNNCFIILAEKTGKRRFCQLGESFLQSRSADRSWGFHQSCLLALVSNHRDSQLCSQYKSREDGDLCFVYLSLLNSDKSLCERLSTADKKALCLRSWCIGDYFNPVENVICPGPNGEKAEIAFSWKRFLFGRVYLLRKELFAPPWKIVSRFYLGEAPLFFALFNPFLLFSPGAVYPVQFFDFSLWRLLLSLLFLPLAIWALASKVFSRRISLWRIYKVSALFLTVFFGFLLVFQFLNAAVLLFSLFFSSTTAAWFSREEGRTFWGQFKRFSLILCLFILGFWILNSLIIDSLLFFSIENWPVG